MVGGALWVWCGLPLCRGRGIYKLLGGSTFSSSAHRFDLPSANSDNPNRSLPVAGYMLFALFHIWINLLYIYCPIIATVSQGKSSSSLKNTWETQNPDMPDEQRRAKRWFWNNIRIINWKCMEKRLPSASLTPCTECSLKRQTTPEEKLKFSQKMEWLKSRNVNTLEKAPSMLPAQSVKHKPQWLISVTCLQGFPLGACCRCSRLS